MRVAEALLSLLRRKAADLPEGDPARIEAQLGSALAEAGTRWPRLVLEDEIFLRHLAGMAAEDEPDLAGFFGALHLVDLFLACACLHGVPGAIDTFEREYLTGIERYLRCISGAPVELAEVKQRLLAKLFVAQSGAPAKIATYTGRGPLGSWIGVSAQREAISARRAVREHDPYSESDGLGAGQAALLPDPEIEFVKRKYAREFEQALREALEMLPERERVIFRLNLVNGVSLEKIGTLYGVNQSTVSRWLARARESVMDEVQHRLAERLKVSTDEFRSVVHAVQSEVHVSISRIFAAVD
jgi:RNA polymerase sigma-70 factor, ECF subfamily